MKYKYAKVLKTFLPKKVVIFISNIRNLYRLRRSPRYTDYKGPLESVLQCKIAYNEYGGYCIPLNGYFHAAPQTIYRGEVWERETTDFIISHLGNGDVIHAGAFFGDFLPVISKENADYITWAFEPVPESYRCASITVIINNLNNVKLFNVGLGQSCSRENIKIKDDYYGEFQGGGSKIVRDDANKESLLSIEITTIDKVIPDDRKIGIIHLDLEGFEKEALAGALNTIKRCKPILIIETLPDNAWLSENILSLGYTRSEKWVDHNRVLYPISNE